MTGYVVRRAFVQSALILASACSGSHGAPTRDAGSDASVTRTDGGTDASTDARRRRDAGNVDDHCRASGVRFADGNLQPTCDVTGSCFDPMYYPDGNALCEYGLCCRGRVDPSSCECRCGDGPPCIGASRSCCRPENYPHLQHLDPEQYYCLLENDCAEF
jgi:hypothetical protein